MNDELPRNDDEHDEDEATEQDETKPLPRNFGGVFRQLTARAVVRPRGSLVTASHARPRAACLRC